MDNVTQSSSVEIIVRYRSYAAVKSLVSTICTLAHDVEHAIPVILVLFTVFNTTLE